MRSLCKTYLITGNTFCHQQLTVLLTVITGYYKSYAITASYINFVLYFFAKIFVDK